MCKNHLKLSLRSLGLKDERAVRSGQEVSCYRKDVTCAAKGREELCEDWLVNLSDQCCCTADLVLLSFGD